MSKLLFMDTETGGLNPAKHSLLSVAFVVVEDDQITEKKEWFISEDGAYRVTGQAMEVNKIDLGEHYKKSLPPLAVIFDMQDFFKTHFEKEKANPAGHNVNFDIGFLTYLFGSNNINFSEYVSHRQVETASIGRFLIDTGRVKAPDDGQASLEYLLQYFGIEVPEGERHTAMGDALATADLYLRMKKFVQIM